MQKRPCCGVKYCAFPHPSPRLHGCVHPPPSPGKLQSNDIVQVFEWDLHVLEVMSSGTSNSSHFEALSLGPFCAVFLLGLSMTPLCIHTQMYAKGAHVWYHSRSKGAPLLAIVIGHSP